MKINREEIFEVKYSFLKPMSQNFELLTPLGDVINKKTGSKRFKLVFRVPMLIET